MLAEATLDIELARGVHAGADVRVPEDARAVVALLSHDEALVSSCNEHGLATLVVTGLDLNGDAVDNTAALFADAVSAVSDERFLRDRPVGYFGAGVAGAAVLIAASARVNEVGAVVAQDAPTELMASHLSGVRAPTLLLVDPDDPHLIGRTREALPPVPAMSSELQLVAGSSPAVDWFDTHLRGVMRGQRRALWRQA